MCLSVVLDERQRETTTLGRKSLGFVETWSAEYGGQSRGGEGGPRVGDGPLAVGLQCTKGGAKQHVRRVLG